MCIRRIISSSWQRTSASYQNGCCTGSHKLIPSINCRTYFNFLFSLKVILSHIKDLRDRMYKFECNECMSNYKNFRSCLVCKCIPTAHWRQSRRSDKVPNSGLGPKWDQSAKKVPKKSLFCLQVPNFSLISINERIASI